MSFRILLWIVCMTVTTQVSHGMSSGSTQTEAITFSAAPKKLYLPLNEAAKKLRWAVTRDEAGRATQINRYAIPAGSLRTLVDGTELVSTADLQAAGATVAGPAEDGSMTIGNGWRRFILRPAAQKVEIDLSKQKLQGWQGNRQVIETRISSGKNGRTPPGEFRAGPYRAKMHRSSLYNNAPMPWSVQINGHIFVHGYTSVPNYPASHGCVRMPLNEGNPAKFFYEWVQTGSPVSVKK